MPYAARMIRSLRLPAVAVLTAALAAFAPAAAQAAKKHSRTPTKIGHVFVIVLENESADATFAPDSKAPYLAKTLRAKGVFVPNYYGTTHVSQGNYTAMISGQGPTTQIQVDCPTYAPFVSTGTGSDGQLLGSGCVYPSSVPTIAGQLKAKKLTWKGYMEDMGNNVARDGAATCAHPALGAADQTLKASVGDQYATRHNPFVYFQGITGSSDCAKNDVPLTRLTGDLKSIKKTANFNLISPNLCHDGHDEPCVNGEPGGLESMNTFLQAWVPKITSSAAYKKDGMLIVTFDEAEIFGTGADNTNIPNAPKYPNVTANSLTGGTGGGRVGAVILSKRTKPGTTTQKAYNHFSLLGSVEGIFGLKKLGYAAHASTPLFGKDIFSVK